ncbi:MULTISPECIES: ABC transporter ATP-binding protein [Bacillaceae]|uniref:ABC transporter ATP-binding protein n=1 Tax=Bacillaceae TaxID=186817 RepID=UPI001F2F3982|nr:ABC transporter ATP-binding protein [Litchfieldia alkalitelluris]
MDNLSGGYGASPVVKDISFTVEKGTFFGIIGPNGCGKTTLLKLLTGVLPNKNGFIYIEGRLLESYNRKELARKITLLPQQPEVSFSYTVRDVIAMGRYPYKKGLFHFFDETDEKKVREVIRQLGLEKYQDLPLPSLSGGEQQRVFLAKALVQEPSILILDEPTNHLDVSFQIELMNLIKELVNTQKVTVIAVLHDLNMASLYCDQILLMKDGRRVSINEPNQVLHSETLGEVYGTALERKEHPIVPKPLITFQPTDFGKKTKWNLQQYDERDMWVVESNIYLKTLTTEAGKGINWVKRFEFHKNFHVGLENQSSDKFMYTVRREIEHGKQNLIKVQKDNLHVLSLGTFDRENVLGFFINGYLGESEFFQIFMKIGQWLSSFSSPEENHDPVILLAATQVNSEVSIETIAVEMKEALIEIAEKKNKKEENDENLYEKG